MKIIRYKGPVWRDQYIELHQNNGIYMQIINNIRKRIYENNYKPSLIFNLARGNALSIPIRTILNIMPVYKSRKLSHTKNIGVFFSNENYFFWILGSFLKYQDLINSYLSMKDRINISIFNGDYQNSLEILNTINEKVSYSFWSLSYELIIRKEFLKENVKKDEFIGNSFEEEKLWSFSESGLHYVELFLAELNEYRAANISESDSYSHLLLAYEFDISRKCNFSILNHFAHYSIIDQYNVFKSLLKDNILRGYPIDSEIHSLLIEISKEINDTELKDLLSSNDSLVNSDILKVVKEYIYGNYDNVINEVDDLKHVSSLTLASLIPVYVKSKLYTGTNFERDFFDELSASIAKIYQLDEFAFIHLDELKKLALLFPHEPWICPILNWATEINIRLDFSNEAINFYKNYVSKIKLAKLPIGILKKEDNGINLSMVPEYRLIKDIPNYQVNTNYQRSPLEIENFSIDQKRYISQNKHGQLKALIVEKFLENRLYINLLDKKFIVEFILSQPNKNSSDYISILNILYIFNESNYDKFKELLDEYFEELIDIQGDHHISNWYKEHDVLDINETFFLENVCQLEMLDTIYFFTSQLEVYRERINIIDLLIPLIPKGSTYREEKDKLYEKLFIEQFKSKVESGKIFVDIQSLKIKNGSKYKKLYSIAKSLPEEEITNDSYALVADWPLQASESNADSDKIKLAVLKDSSYVKINYELFYELSYDFSSSNNYGLDKYLSAEIRHGFFETKMRSCFEKHHLVTSQNSEKYVKNIHWNQKYYYYSDDVREQLNDILEKFSSELDKLISSTNNLFRVSRISEQESLNTPGLFNFTPYFQNIVETNEILVKSTSYEDFIEEMLEYLCSLCEKNAKNVQEFLTTEFSQDVQALLDMLYENLNRLAPSQNNFFELQTAIDDARNNFIKVIEEVISWFNPSWLSIDSTQELIKTSIEAAVEIFNSLHRDVKNEINLNIDNTNNILNFRPSKNLVIALITALDNAFSWKTANSKIEICGIDNNYLNRYELKILNNIDSNHIQDRDYFLEKIRSNWQIGNTSSLSTTEGGSGLYKIFDLLVNMFPNHFKTKIDIINNTFQLEIWINYENTNS